MENSDAVPEDTFEDLQECFRPVAKKHGRELFAACLYAGVGQQAAMVLAGLCEKHQSRHGINALAQLASSLEQLIGLLGQIRGWTPEMMAEVDRDIQAAWGKRDGGRVLVIH